MNVRRMVCAALIAAALGLFARPVSADPVRSAQHLRTLASLRQAVSRIQTQLFIGGNSRATLLARLDSVKTSIEQEQYIAAADVLKNDVLPTLDGTAGVADILPGSRSKTHIYSALLELHDMLRSESGLRTAGQSNTRVSEQNGIISYRRLNGASSANAPMPLLGAQFSPFWLGFTEPDPDGTCANPGNDATAGCLADPSVVNGDNQQTVVSDRLGTPFRTKPWGYEYQVGPGAVANALTPVWSTFLQAADQNKVNLVRIFGSFTLLESFGGNYFPWRFEANKFQVQDAICQNKWDDSAETGDNGYFDRLRGFVSAADVRGVAVQYSLFVRQEIDPDSIAFGTWSVQFSDVTGNFTCPDGLTYAMPRDGQNSATRDFFNVESGGSLTPVGRVQRLYIRKLVSEALKPSPDVPTGFTNIVFEVMNEPISNRLRDPYPSQEIVRNWQAFVIRTIRETEAELRQQWPALGGSLISLNAVASARNPQYEDTDVYDWRVAQDAAPGDAALAQLDQVALINYHGYFTANVSAPSEDLSLASLNRRLQAHFLALGSPNTPRSIAVLMSTDGVRVGVGDFQPPGVNDPLASVAESTTCSTLASSDGPGGDPVNLGRSNCRIAPNVGPCSGDTLQSPIGVECAAAHGIPALVRVFRSGYRNGVVSGEKSTLQNFIEDYARRVITGVALREDPTPGTGPDVPRVAGAFHFHNQSGFEDAMEDMAQVPRPDPPPPVPVAGGLGILFLGLALGRGMKRRPQP